MHIINRTFNHSRNTEILHQCGVCCDGELSGDFLVKFDGCKLKIQDGKKVLLQSGNLGLCNWAFPLKSYDVHNIYIKSGETIEINLKFDFIFLRVYWDYNINEGDKNLEVRYYTQNSAVGSSTVPIIVDSEGEENDESEQILNINDIWVTNAPYNQPYNSKFKITNTTDVDCDISILTSN